MPDVLDPYVGTGGEEQPLDGDEEETDDVRRERHAHEEDGERLGAGEDPQ